MELTAAGGGVLGALVEQEWTTPPGYPLTDTALMAACNPATSRDLVVEHDTATVRLAVRSLPGAGLLRTVHRTGERKDEEVAALREEVAALRAEVARLAQR